MRYVTGGKQSFGSSEDVCLVAVRRECGVVVVFLEVTGREVSFGRARSEFHKKSAELEAITA